VKCPLDSYQPLWYRHQAPQLVRPLPHAPACSCPSSCPLHPLELPLTDGGPDAEGAVDDEHNEETQVAQRAITAGKGGAGRGGGAAVRSCASSMASKRGSRRTTATHADVLHPGAGHPCSPDTPNSPHVTHRVPIKTTRRGHVLLTYALAPHMQLHTHGTRGRAAAMR
jgi:hypothetical protein